VLHRTALDHLAVMHEVGDHPMSWVMVRRASRIRLISGRLMFAIRPAAANLFSP
jgi:hypothetical protein